MIVASFDLNFGWKFTGNPSTDFSVCFTNGNADRISPDRFRFGCILLANGVKVFDYEWPAPNAVVREISSQRMFEFPINAKIDDEIVLSLWATESGKRVEGKTTFVVPRPESPYPSWVWLDGYWTSPVSYPSDGNFYEWDEDNQKWFEVASKSYYDLTNEPNYEVE